MDQDNGSKKENNKGLEFIAELFWLGIVIFIVAALLWGFSFITTRLFIALAIIGGLLIFLSILFIVLFIVFACIFDKQNRK